MYKSYRFGFHSSKLQEEKLEQFFAINRYIYNWVFVSLQLKLGKLV
ncbi:helix-turn-helix domain-containing protein [Marinifilum caeruleilacunae]